MGRRPSGKPTIADVAALAGVSVSAVSKVVNDRSGISEATRARVREAAEKLQWSRSATAVALRGARTRAIGMVAPRSADLLVADPHFALLIGGIERELAPRDHGLLLHIVGEEAETEERAYRRLAEERRVDGVILTESRLGDPRFALLRRLRLPAVLVGTPWRSDPIVSVRAQRPDAGVQAAVAHLLERGHRRIAYVCGPEDRVHTGVRRRAFEGALRTAGLRPARLVSADFTGQSAAVAMAELLDEEPADRPTAVLFANDTMALAGISVARRRGWEVPRDLSVIGHDDLPLGELTHPRLTTVRQDLVQLGRAAAVALLRQLDGVEGPLPSVPDPELVVRESTGPAPPH